MRTPEMVPRGLVARLARERGVSRSTIERAIDPSKRPSERLKHENDGRPHWTPAQLYAMDAAFCAAMEREIARGSERPRRSALRYARSV